MERYKKRNTYRSDHGKLRSPWAQRCRFTTLNKIQLTVQCTVTLRVLKSVPMISTGSITFQPWGSASGPSTTPPSEYTRARMGDGGLATVCGRKVKLVDSLGAQSPPSPTRRVKEEETSQKIVLILNEVIEGALVVDTETAAAYGHVQFIINVDGARALGERRRKRKKCWRRFWHRYH